MNQFLSVLRLSAFLLVVIGTAAHATTPGTITPEQDDTAQQEQNDTVPQDQNQNDDGFIEEEEQDDQSQNQDDINGYGDEQDQGDNWGDDQNDDRNDRGQDDGYDRGQDDGYDRGQGGKNQDDKGYRPGKPGRDQGKKPRYDRRPRRLVETVNVYQQYFGGARFPLYMMVNNLQRFQGYRLQTVVINGSSDGGMGMAVFCGSQCGQMQNVGYYRTAYPIRTLGERVNPNSAQWFLELRGNFWIESIQLEFVR